MRFALKDYQVDAVARILRNLTRAREDTRRHSDLIAFALSATTGAGKTVMATAVIEALFEGSEDFGVDADPSAVVLWVTDDPSLNAQTRHRIIECGDRLDVGRLVVIGDGGFDQETFDPGNVYFLNVQKLASSTTWVKRDDTRRYTLWDTIRNTIEDETRTLYLILDEAHRGMRNATGRSADTNRSTIVRRLINGHGDIPAAPIVWGISATVQRFSEAMAAAHAEGRITYPPIQVDPRAVQESGLLKDTIVLDFPDESGNFETVFLRNALRETRDASVLWADYAAQEGLPDPVVPLLVLQVPNKPSQSDLVRLLNVIREEWPQLGAGGVANVFGEHVDLVLGNDTVRYIAPQDVQEARHVRVLLAKDAISTGWDCPRAEVLCSLRPARDRTYITQMLGRMVRTPLARRIDSDERLNSVTCLLPNFDRSTATDVALVLTGEKVDQDDPGSGSEQGMGRKVLTHPVTMEWNRLVSEEVGAFLATLPSEATPKGNTKPVKRLLSLAATIAVDGLMDSANTQAFEEVFRALDGQMARHEDAVLQGVEAIYTAEVRRITRRITADSLVEATRQERADDRTVDDAYRAASRTLGAEVANRYATRLAMRENEGEVDFHAAKARIAALLTLPDVMDAVEAEADKLARTWLNELRTRIRGLSEERRSAYDELTRQDRVPQQVGIVTPKSRIENTRDADDRPLPTREQHLLADEHGVYPVAKLNDWELRVLDTELARSETVAWYRNPSTPAADALQIPYQDSARWKPMQPDFIFFSRNLDGTLAASIVDPHGDHLADALPKLRGLADFAEKYQGAFVRIEAVSEVDRKELRWLDLTVAAVRAAIREASSATELYHSAVALSYV